MWQANKTGILALLGGFAVLGGLYYYLHEQDPLTARKVLSAGVCLLLFTVATATWLSARRELKQRRQD